MKGNEMNQCEKSIQAALAVLGRISRKRQPRRVSLRDPAYRLDKIERAHHVIELHSPKPCLNPKMEKARI
jgi:hypothetical protein